MIKLLTAYTLEADDADFAISEILQQLDLAQNALAHSAGFLFCHPDFIETGVAQRIGEALPFEVVGGTSIATVTKGLSDLVGLSLSVLTSDTVSFQAVHTTQRGPQAMEALYQEGQKGQANPPSMIFPFVPLGMAADMEVALEVMDRLSGGVPIFGSLTVDHTPDFSRVFSLHNGEAFQDGLVFLFAFGDLTPEFYVAEISPSRIQKQRAIITDSDGHILKKVNDMLLIDYLESIGLQRGQAEQGIAAIPFVIDLGDGTKPVARAFHSITEEGFVLVGGHMPIGATLAIGSLEYADVMRMAQETMDFILSGPPQQSALMFPCASHFFVLGSKASEEVALFHQRMDDACAYQVCYSGGEICPVYDQKGKLHNRFHSFTCVACKF